MSDNIKLIFKNQNIFRILQLFASQKDPKFYLREIARQLNLNAGAIHGDLVFLEKAGLVISQQEGKNKYFKLNSVNQDFNYLKPLLSRGGRNNQEQEIITVLFEEHWVSPLTQSVNYFGWQACSDDSIFSTRLGSCAGVYYDAFLKFPFNEERWTERSKEVNGMLENKKFIFQHYQEFKELIKKMDTSLLKIVRQPQINSSFIENLREVYLLGIEACRLGYVGVVADMPTELLTKTMRTIIEKRTTQLKIKETVPELVNILSSPPELSQAFVREKAFLKLAEVIIKKPTKNWSLDSKIFSAIQDYFDRYYWTDFGHFGTDKSIKDVVEELKTMIAKETLIGVRKRIREIDNYRVKTRVKKQVLYKKLSLNEKEKLVFESAGTFALIKALRLEYLSGLNSQISRLTGYLSKKYKVDKKLFYFCHFGEILNIYEHGLAKKFIAILKNRSKFCIFRDFSNCYGGQILAGQEAQQFYDKYVKEVQKEINDIESFHGSVAYPGRVKGPVRIINSPKEMNKMQNNDILVTTQTIPEMLPAMKKAAAFITNSGGITCHAAIVAREMKKPCIVGTKIATKILHDGDFVQVDAFKGVINIIRIN